MARQQGQFNQQASKKLNEAELSSAAGGCESIKKGDTLIRRDPDGSEQGFLVSQTGKGKVSLTPNQG